MIISRAGERLTIAFADRRPNITDESRDVLGQVTLIKDIILNHTEREPHRAHLEILSDLSLEQCIKWMYDNKKPQNFDGLLAAWLAKLDTEELNKQFYRRLFTWYELAVETARFPTEGNRVIKAEEHVIRLITRLLFIWFIKEKGLVAEALFNNAQIQELLVEDDFENGDSYYRAVLQNLFFATLNTEIDRRKFSTEGYSTNRDFSRYRYKAQMEDPDRLLELFAETPFINGGLFDCLDSWEATGEDSYRIDCFSDNQYDGVSIPNRLFFGKDGLIPLLEHYKFTVEENTPIDQEVALDPELLGKVFEHLLATLNPETGRTVRKETGSYYTPRAIVDYMVEEALIGTLSQKCQSTDGNTEHWNERLHYLFDYAKVCNDASIWFDDQEIDEIVKTISELKILDPAVGSGAFPMGVLHKLTLALRRLDPDNTRWETLQRKMAIVRSEKAYNTQDQQERNEELTEISDTFERYRDSDFGRKLYLIQNSIFGVDIQPIACQIAKLRFFISLAIEQEPNTDEENNFGIKPLPNLETRFVAANTLIKIQQQMSLKSEKASHLELALRDNREKHFHATTRQQKRKYKDRDEELRAELAAELKGLGTFADDVDKIAQWDPYDQNKKADWFDPELMFGVTDGFDVVIGNPPYGAKIEPSDLKIIKANIKDTKNSNSAALFIDYAKNHLIKTDTNNGVVAFIVPKSLLFSERWLDLTFTILANTTILIDVEKAFEKVKLEQVVFIWNTYCFDNFYIGRKFLNNTFRRTTRIEKKYPKKFQAWICDVSNKEILLGSKMEGIGTYLKKISMTKRGLSIQSKLKAHGDTPVLGGKEIKRYVIDGIKGFINRSDLDLTNNKIQFLLQPKVISQRLVAHVQNPIPHIKITSSVDKSGDILSVDTVENTVIINQRFDPVFVAALLNSTLINWYAYKFIFCSAIRTMDLDNYYVGKIPIPDVTSEQQTPIIELVNQILAAKQANPDVDTSDLENEIDKLVYALYDLTEDEIAIVEGVV